MVNQEKKKTILIADDEDDNRFLLSFLLKEEGWQVSEARDGVEALEKALLEQPDVLVLDNRMPEMTGAEVYQILKDKAVNIAVVLASAYGRVDELAQTLEIKYFIAKPFDIPELLKCIEAAYADTH